jgi:hypothetical protein
MKNLSLIYFLFSSFSLSALLFYGDSHKIDNAAAKYLMTYDEYSFKEKTIPYQFKIQKNTQKLYYFGANHSFDPKNIQFKKLKEFWQQFLQDTKGQPRMVLLEGGVFDLDIQMGEDQIIKRYCETGLLQLLAQQVKIKTECPEPPQKLITNLLLKRFTSKQVRYLYFARQVCLWNKFISKPRFEKYISERSFSLREMKKIHRQIFNQKFVCNDQMFFNLITDPVHTFFITNKIARQWDILRDIYIINVIRKHWKDGVSIFIGYGATHAIMQQKALVELLK